MDECGCVHADEGDESSEVQEFRTLFKAHQKRSEESYRAKEKNVVAWNSGFRTHDPEESLGQRIGATHAVEQARGAELGGDA